jgi:NitT/TauT family transport system substrate-binding protein
MRNKIYSNTGVTRLFLSAFLLSASPASAQVVKVKLGSSLSPPELHVLAPYVALERGLFKKQGLDVEIVEIAGDPNHTRALLSGELDAAVIIGGTAVMVSASKGAKIKAWLIPNPVSPFHIVARRESATTLQGLVGKSVAVSGIGGYSYHVPRIVLERSGVDPDKANYVAAGSPADRFRALVSGKVDAALVTLDEVAKLAQYPQLISLADVAKIAPELPNNFSMAREEYIAKNPETMYKLTRALIEASRFIAANKAGFIAIAAKVIKDESPDILSKAYDLADPKSVFGVNGDISEAAYNYTANFLRKVGFMPDPVPYDKFFERSFVDRVLREQGRL